MFIENLMEPHPIVSLISPNPDMDDIVIDSNNKSSLKVSQQNHSVPDVVILRLILESWWSKFSLTTGDHFIITDCD